MEVGYLTEDPPLIYEIPTSNFIPTFFTRRGILSKFNEEDDIGWKFILRSSDESEYTEVPVVNCADLIESFTDLKDDEKKSMIDALI